MKIFGVMTRSDLEKLHGHLHNIGGASAKLKQAWFCVRLAQYLGEANLLMAKYRQEDTTMLEFATVCKPFADCLQLEFTAFAAIIERTKKGEVYNG